MSLINFDSSGDPWLSDYESCERLYRDIVDFLDNRGKYPKDSLEYNSLSASIRIRLKQYLQEAKQLNQRIDDAFSLTHAEKERRKRLVESLLSKHMHLSKNFENRNIGLGDDRRRLLGDGGVSTWVDDPASSTPLLSDVDLSVDQLRSQQERVLSEQDAGLERLSSIIGRQKNIAITIGSEVESQNELVDNITNHMERTGASLDKESQHVVAVTTSDSTWAYWSIIIVLFIAILVLTFAF